MRTLIKISLCEKINKRQNTKQNGFALIEILVSLFLIALVIFSITLGTNSSRDKLDEALDALERTIRFSLNESVLRGSVIRMHFLLDKNPVEYSVQYGPSDGMVLPGFKQFDNEDKLTLLEIEKRNKMIKGINQNFMKVDEFADSNKNLDEDVKLIGMATNLRNTFIQNFEGAYYIYPNGEKDDLLVVVASANEVAALIVPPYTLEIKRQYRTFTLSEFADENDLEDKQDEIAREFYEKWRKE